MLSINKVSLIGGGVDEAPMAYKDIRRVMANQQELVEVLGTFHQKLFEWIASELYGYININNTHNCNRMADR